MKAENGNMTIVLEILKTAIREQRKVGFQYFEYRSENWKKMKNDGSPFILSPYTITWDGSFYYVSGWSETHERIASFRLDCICQIPEILQEEAVEKPKQFSVETLAKDNALDNIDQVQTVELICENRIRDALLASIGREVYTEPAGNDHFRCSLDVPVGQDFYAWVFRFNGGVRIDEPREVLYEYKKTLRQQIDWDRFESVEGICAVNTRETGFKIKTQCPFCREYHDIAIDLKDLISWEIDGVWVQDAFSYLSADDRERIITGTCPACWEIQYEQDEEEAEYEKLKSF